MTLRKIFVSAVMTLALTTALSAQDEKEFQQWMKESGASMGKIKKALDAKTADDAVATAERLGVIYASVEKYFAKMNLADAVKFSQDAQAGAKALAAAAKAGTFDEAAGGFKMVGGSCQGCHMAHREKLADGSYKFK